VVRVFASCVDVGTCSVHLFDSHEVPTEVVVEKIVVAVERKYFLLLKLSGNQLLHLFLRELALLEHQVDLLEWACRVEFQVLLDHLEAGFKHPVHLVRPSDAYFGRLTRRPYRWDEISRKKLVILSL
jgi:hypothetical protein